MRADGRETGLFEPRGQFFDRVGALVVLFKVALPRAIRLEAEEVDLVVDALTVRCVSAVFRSFRTAISCALSSGANF